MIGALSSKFNVAVINSVLFVGPQQYYLKAQQSRLWKYYDSSPTSPLPTSKPRPSSRTNGKYSKMSTSLESVTKGMNRVEIKSASKVGRSGSFDEIKEEQADSLLKRRQQRHDDLVILKTLHREGAERASTAPMVSGVQVTGSSLIVRPISSHQKTRNRLK